MIRSQTAQRFGWVAIVPLVLTVALSISFAASPTSQPHHGDQVSRDGPLSLEDHMEQMQSSLRELKRQIIDPRKNMESANIVAEMLVHAAQAKQMRPPKEREFASDKRQAFVMGFRKKMNGLCASLVQLEASLLDDDNIQAQKHLAKVLDYRFKGHRQYKQE